MIDWQQLGDRLVSSLPVSPGRWQAQALSGGDINQAFRLVSGEQQFFVKLNRVELLSMFIAEQAGLEAIQRSRTIRVPRVYLTGEAGAHAFIVMEYIELGGRPDAETFAVQLAAMHRTLQQRFGFECDNTIGSTPQLNAFDDSWTGFWRDRRLGFQLELARQNGFDSALIDAGFRLAENLHILFSSYHPQPSLLHGDLWSGNQGSDAEGIPVIFDPACYYGDHETDLAMMELFGNPGPRFFAAYHEQFAIDAGYAVRRELYNLYHVLNHANLFGGGYAMQARNMVDRLLAQL